jgi:hypothetical protein
MIFTTIDCSYIGGKARRKTKTKWVNNIKMELREIGWDGMD